MQPPHAPCLCLCSASERRVRGREKRRARGRASPTRPVCPGGGVDERERALSVIRRLGDTINVLEREGDVSGVTSLNTYVESLKSKFEIDFPD